MYNPPCRQLPLPRLGKEILAMDKNVRAKLFDSVYKRLHITTDEYRAAEGIEKMLIQFRRFAVEAAVVVLEEYEELNR